MTESPPFRLTLARLNRTQARDHKGCTMNCFPFGYSQLIDTCPILRTLTPCFTQPTQSSPFLNPLLAFTAVLQGPHFTGSHVSKAIATNRGSTSIFWEVTQWVEHIQLDLTQECIFFKPSLTFAAVLHNSIHRNHVSSHTTSLGRSRSRAGIY